MNNSPPIHPLPQVDLLVRFFFFLLTALSIADSQLLQWLLIYDEEHLYILWYIFMHSFELVLFTSSLSFSFEVIYSIYRVDLVEDFLSVLTQGNRSGENKILAVWVSNCSPLRIFYNWLGSTDKNIFRVSFQKWCLLESFSVGMKKLPMKTKMKNEICPV